MRAIILAFALLFGLGNAQADPVQDLVNTGDDAAAFALASQQSESGDATAHEWLGWFYDRGRGVDQNIEKAVYHYRIAIAGGRNYARWRVGVMIDEGTTQGSLEEAYSLFGQAADDGFSNAMVSLAVMQATGRGTPVDYDGAFANYMRAARAGNDHGIQGIGVMYALGQSVAVNNEEAAAWFLISAMAGNETGQANLQRLAANLTGDDLQRIAARADEITAELGLEIVDTAPEAPAQKTQ